MSQDFENSLTIQALYSSPYVSVSDYNCQACRSGPAGEEHVESHQIVLLRHGVFRKHIGRRSLTLDVNQAVFFAKGSTYQISHPIDGGDRGTVFTLAPQVLNDMLGELDPAYAEQPEDPFPFVSGPCGTDTFWKHRELLQTLEGEGARALDPMRVDETALHMMADLLAAAFTRHGEPRKNRRRSTQADHTDRAEAAKSYLAGQMGESITLDDVARHVHTSPFHLSRIFRQHTGIPLHRYLTRLRLRAALEHLADGVGDLAALALELGYSSHSHFTDTFRREFGRTPSDVRGELSRRSLPETSKNPEA